MTRKELFKFISCDDKFPKIKFNHLKHGLITGTIRGVYQDRCSVSFVKTKLNIWFWYKENKNFKRNHIRELKLIKSQKLKIIINEKNNKINNIELIDHIEVKDIIVSMNQTSNEESYTIFRENGDEKQVCIKNNKIISNTYQLTRNEEDYFKSGYYKKLKNKY